MRLMRYTTSVNLGVVEMKKVRKISQERESELKAFIKNKETTSIEARRAQAILLLNNTVSSDLIESVTGTTKKNAFKLRKKYENKGLKALEQKKKKPRSLLTRGQVKEVARILHNNLPYDFGIECDHWTTSILAQLIKEQYEVTFKSKTSIYLMFKKAKFTYHKPGQKYAKRDEEAIKKWKQEVMPLAKEALADEKTIVLTEDEMMLTTQTTVQKIWLPQGEFPKIDVSSNRKRRCIYGFLNIKTGAQHAFKAMGANSEETCKVLKKISNTYEKMKIVLFWDNAPWHKSNEIKEFLRTTKHNFHLVAFPPYAPDENPQEHVWKAGRAKITHNKFIQNIDKATDEFIGYLNHEIFNYKFLDFKAPFRM